MSENCIKILSIWESRWYGTSDMVLTNGKRLIYSRHEDEHATKERGVAIMLDELTGKEHPKG